MATRTEIALIARGVNSTTARNLVSEGYTLRALQQKTEAELIDAGLQEFEIKKIHDTKRPPIPTDTANKILFDSALTCAVCRDKNNPIVIHHLNEWHKSKDHSENNLIVLCLNCHSKAHSTSTISINLNEQRLRVIKDEWLKIVRTRESDALFAKSTWNPLGAVWDYFNHNRVIDIANEVGIDLMHIDGYSGLVASGVITESGSLIFPATMSTTDRSHIHYIYDGSIPGFDRSLVRFYGNVLRGILESTQWLNLTEIFRKSSSSLAQEYPIVSVTGSFRYKNARKNISGPGQTIEGHKSARGLSVEFSIDAWETTSSSAHLTNLSGVWRSTCILLVRNITQSEKQAIVRCTCLAIGTGFTEYSGYVPPVAYKYDAKEDDEVDESC
jgi:hypothetical protein